MPWRAVLAAVVLALVAAAPARAEEPGIAIGRHVFGPVACGTPAMGRAVFADPMTIAGSDPATCRILLNEAYADELPADMRCTLVLHEYGHLAGHAHSSNPRSVMYPTYNGPDERCTRTFSASSRARRARGTSETAKSSG